MCIKAAGIRQQSITLLEVSRRIGIIHCCDVKKVSSCCSVFGITDCSKRVCVCVDRQSTLHRKLHRKRIKLHTFFKITFNCKSAKIIVNCAAFKSRIKLITASLISKSNFSKVITITRFNRAFFSRKVMQS